MHSRCKLDESKSAAGRELRRSKTASRILPAEFTVEEPRTFTSEEDDSKAAEKFEASPASLRKLIAPKVVRKWHPQLRKVGK